MPRSHRIQPAGYVFHVINRGNGRMTIFRDDDDYAAFERVMLDAGNAVNMRLLAYCIMPNHWHLILQPRENGDLSRYMHRLTITHVRRWHQYRQTNGEGHLYQGTYKSFPVQTNGHYLTVCRYVERNALRAGLVEHAQDWRWCSLWRRCHPKLPEDVTPKLHRWPVNEPKQWLRIVNTKQSKTDINSIRNSINRGRPYGSESWQQYTAARLDLKATFKPRGRPPKKVQNKNT